MSNVSVLSFTIQEGQSRFIEGQALTPDEVGDAVRESNENGNTVELYAFADDEPTPLIGFIFKSGVYQGWGLGAEAGEESWLADWQNSTKPFIGRPGEQMVSILKDGLVSEV